MALFIAVEVDAAVAEDAEIAKKLVEVCLLYTSPSPRD